MRERPRCLTDGCDNLSARVGRNSYSTWCSTCLKRRKGRKMSGSKKRRFVNMKAAAGRCEVCEMKHETPAFFDVHHIDGNHRNDARSNLIVVCPNCHRNAHLGMIRADLGSPRWESDNARLF